MRPALVSVVLVLLACGDDTPPKPPIFPADYRSTYVEVRNCRQSADHDLNHVRVLADPAAAGPYMTRSAPFPDGAIVLKEEYDFGDNDCTGPIKQWTVIQRLPAGSSSTTLDWHWQKVDATRKVTSDDEARCYDCHKGCGVPPDGYEGTCAVP